MFQGGPVVDRSRDDGPIISLGFAPGPLALDAADLAERVGYERLWLYDSAAIWEDVWLTMAW